MLNYADDQLIKYITGDLPEMEKLALESKLASSDHLKKRLNQLEAVWQLTNQLSYDSTHTDDAWNSFQHIVEAPLKKTGFDWLKLTASILILAVLSVGIWFYSSTNNSLTLAHNAYILEDNSIIELNKSSEILLSKDFGNNNRELMLNGEAFFNVSKSKHPFVVHTHLGDITVKGTEFNVYAPTSSDFVMIELFEGIVEVNAKTDKIQLNAGDRLMIMANGFNLFEDKAVVKSWGEAINCKNMPLSYILGQLNLYYNTNHQVKSKVLKEHYTVNLPINNLQECLNILSQISDRKFVLKNNVIVLK